MLITQTHTTRLNLLATTSIIPLYSYEYVLNVSIRNEITFLCHTNLDIKKLHNKYIIHNNQVKDNKNLKQFRTLSINLSACALSLSCVDCVNVSLLIWPECPDATQSSPVN